jgi:hypothetical protein
MWRWLRKLLGLRNGDGRACEEGPRAPVTRGTVERESQRLRRDLLTASVALGRALDAPGGVDALMSEWSGEVDALPELPAHTPKGKM